MPKQYICELCKKVFAQKGDFTRHSKDKKTPCIPMEKIETIIKERTINNNAKAELSTIFNYCLDILRNNEHLTGDKALRTLAHLLDLLLLEPQFGTQIDIDTFNYDLGSKYTDDTVDKHKAQLLKMVRFSNLAQEKEDNIPNVMKHLWDEILSVHPITKNIFLTGRGFDIQHQSTYKKLIGKLASFDFNSVEEDILGEAYEEVIKDVMIGKVLGQYFTPPKVKQMMVDLVDPQIKDCGKIETVFDLAMGTGGFLITCLRHLVKKSKIQGVKLDWNFISSQGLGGREAETDTYQLAVSNMLISSGRMFKALEKGDSIRDPITNKYDIVLANPPFGIDGLTYDEILSPLRNEHMPISSGSAVPLFLQAIIHILKIGGRCAVVLPNGQELSSKDTTLITVREYLMKTCDLKEVIYLPAGTFTHTSIKTCVFYFHKKREGKDVLETKINYSKTTQKETKRSYIFSKVHQTTKIKFSDYNTENGIKNPLAEVGIQDIAKNNYSLNYTEYLKDDMEDVIYEDGVEIKTLGEVCEFKNGKGIKKDNLTEGEYFVIGGGQKPMGLHNEYNTDENTILCSSSGAYAGYISKYNRKVWASDCFSIKPLSDNVNKNYLYYMLKIHLQETIYKMQTGAAQPHVYAKNLENLKIPVHPLERQQEIVKYCDFLYEKCIKTSMEKIQELKQLNEYCLSMQKTFGENEVKTLGEVCNMNIKGNTNTKTITNTNEYPFYRASVTNPSGSHNTYCFEGEEYILFVKSGGNSLNPLSLSHGIGKVYLVNGKTSGNTEVVKIVQNTNVALKYLFYFLQSQQLTIQKLAKYSTNLGHIDMNKFKQLKIPIPSLQRQQEIVKYCDFNDRLIKQLEQEIEQNKNQAKMCLSNITKIRASGEPEIVFEDDESEVEEEIPIPLCQAKLRGKGGETCGKPSIGDTGKCKGHKPKSPVK